MIVTTSSKAKKNVLRGLLFKNNVQIVQKEFTGVTVK